MPKKIDDVILPERRRSIREIPIPENRRRVTVDQRPSTDGVKRVHSRVDDVKEEYSSIPPQKPKPTRRSSRGTKRVWIAGLASVALLALATLSLFDRALISYVPKSSNMVFNNEVYSAARTGENEFIYSVVKLSGDKGKSVTVSGDQDVSRPASGAVIVYNDASAEAQTLVENTRFESAAGKIYRIRTPISIPGKKTVAGISQPGSIEVTVYADQPGDSYNSGPTDFTVPGLKGTPRYSTVYARSKGPLAGGFVGKEKVVSEGDLLKARSELRTVLTDELVSKAQAEVPDDFILFQSLSSVSFEDLPQSTSGDAGTANVNLRGSLYGIMFKRADLAKHLAKTKTAILSNELVDLESYETLKLSFSGTPPTELLPLNKINFKVEGSARLVWKTDELALKSDLVGRGKKDLSSVLKNYPTVASADATLRPFWKTQFPKEAEKITIKKLKAE